MNHLRRSVFRILFTTCFFLLIAWLALKLMQHGGDLDGMLKEAQSWFDGKFGNTLNSAMESIRPKVEEMVQSMRTFFEGTITPN